MKVRALGLNEVFISDGVGKMRMQDRAILEGSGGCPGA